MRCRRGWGCGLARMLTWEDDRFPLGRNIQTLLNNYSSWGINSLFFCGARELDSDRLLRPLAVCWKLETLERRIEDEQDGERGENPIIPRPAIAASIPSCVVAASRRHPTPGHSRLIHDNSEPGKYPFTPLELLGRHARLHAGWLLTRPDRIGVGSVAGLLCTPIVADAVGGFQTDPNARRR